LLPDLIRAFERGEAAQIRNPNATRPFQHVLDPVYAYVTLAERLLAGDASAAQAYNFGPPPSDLLDVRQVAEQAVKAWGEGARWTSDAGAHPPEAPALALDPKKAEAELGVRSIFGSLEAVERTVAFHRALRAGQDPSSLMDREIDEAEQRLAARG
jgi:CDP-glucose 4,6-dehydratase